MRVKYTPRALRDINRVYTYLSKQSPSGALNVSTAIYAGVRFVAERPEASERTDDPNVHVKLVQRYRHKIFYSITEDTVEILHIRHPSRRPWKGER
jgi:toxin ParE1/3/4